jgi:hypothetical protein
VLRQLGYREGVRLQTRILDVDFKNDASDDGTRFSFGRELFRSAQHDPAVDLSIPKMLSGANAFGISDIQEAY